MHTTLTSEEAIQLCESSQKILVTTKDFEKNGVSSFAVFQGNVADLFNNAEEIVYMYSDFLKQLSFTYEGVQKIVLIK